MYTVGLTGGIGSGKSTVAALFSELGVTVVNADQVAREVVLPGSPALAAIAGHFGFHYVTRQGELDRPKLRALVFADSAQRQWLEALLHPLIAEQVRAQLQAATSTYAILESPLLLETQQKNLVNRILVVDVTVETQVRRALLRDGSEEQTIRNIIQSQITRELRLQLADDIIENEVEGVDLHDAVNKLHADYLARAKSHTANS